MITDEKLLRPYVEGQDLPFERRALKGVSTYLIGHGEGVSGQQSSVGP